MRPRSQQTLIMYMESGIPSNNNNTLNTEQTLHTRRPRRAREKIMQINKLYIFKGGKYDNRQMQN